MSVGLIHPNPELRVHVNLTDSSPPIHLDFHSAAHQTHFRYYFYLVDGHLRTQLISPSLTYPDSYHLGSVDRICFSSPVASLSGRPTDSRTLRHDLRCYFDMVE